MLRAEVVQTPEERWRFEIDNNQSKVSLLTQINRLKGNSCGLAEIGNESLYGEKASLESDFCIKISQTHVVKDNDKEICVTYEEEDLINIQERRKVKVGDNRLEAMKEPSA